MIIKTIHIHFDKLTAIASEHISSGPRLTVQTSGQSSSRLVLQLLPTSITNDPLPSKEELANMLMYDEFYTTTTEASTSFAANAVTL
ncbi:hypothetical protein Tco_0318522 [Tanacetum coccineum]